MKRTIPAQPVLITSSARLRWLAELIVWFGLGALLIGLLYQIPVRHTVQIGVNDAAYVQGFNDPLNRWGVIDPTSQATTPLRWSRAQSAIIFPQIGLPATATIRWRAVRAPGTPLPQVRVLLNGKNELGTFQTTGDWETHTFTIDGGVFKPNDVFLELRPTPVIEVNGEARGVQVDQARLATSGWPILPYPAQLFYGATAIALATTLVRRRSYQLAAALLIGLVWLLLYRLPLTGYPLRTLPPLLMLTLAALVMIRAVPRVTLRVRPLIVALIGMGVLLVWAAWLWQTAQVHVTLSIPGVEKDFRVFATRALALGCGSSADRATASCVWRADGFYQLGYPFLLWLIKPLTQLNAFLAARIVAALTGVVLLGATWTLAWRMLGRSAGLLALIMLALNPLVVQYGLYLGTDMPFAALWMGGVAALLVPQRHARSSALIAGLLCGGAFLIRHPGLVLLPFGWIVLWLIREPRIKNQHSAFVHDVRFSVPGVWFWFTIGWLVAALPQLVVNLADTGAPLYSQQAKNIWLAVYGNTEWSRWNEASNDVSLRDVVLADPARFFGNWGRNLQAFVGTGANDTSEFGQAIGLRLLPFPANWLALIGLGLWLWRGDRRERLLVFGSTLYVVGVSVGFVLPRFFLPLAPVWAIASIAPLTLLARKLADRWPFANRRQWLLASGLVLIALVSSGPQIGARYVLLRQDADAVAVIETLTPQLKPGDRIVFALPPDDALDKYSALAQYVAQSDQQVVRYVVWSARDTARPALVQNRTPFATFGVYQLFRLR